jgi:hypothetical protein
MKTSLLLCSFLAVSQTVFAANDAALVSISAPATVEPGATFAATIAMKNTGDTTWTAADQYALGSESLRGNTRWALDRLPLANGPVAPGQTGTFTATLTAPLTPGRQNFAWKAVQDSTAEWFGEPIVSSIKIGATNKFTKGDLVVMQAGDGVGTLLTAGSPMFLNGINPVDGTVRFQVAMPTLGTNAFITGGNQFTGMIDLSTNKQQIVMGGYNTNLPYSASVEAANSPVPRAAGTVDINGDFILQARVASGSGQLFAGGTFRGVVSDGRGNFWAGGQNGGIVYLGTNAPQVKIDAAGGGAIRDMTMVGGSIYFSSSQFPASPATAGIVAFNGAPTNVSAPAMVINVTDAQNQGLIPNATGTPNQKGFYINPQLTIAYVVDMRTAATGGGIYRFNGSGTGAPGSWTFAYTLNDSSLATPKEVIADFSGTDPVLYVLTGASSTLAPNRLVKGTDSGAQSTFSELLVAPSGDELLGITFAPAEAAVPVTLKIDRSGSDVVITWTGGVLQSSSSIVGSSFSDINPAPTSPLTTSPSGSAKFYRVRAIP